MCKLPKYYDWHKTLSYDADVTMVIGARGIGKTFGLRLQCIRDYMKDGSRFVEIVRYKNELSDVSDGYFSRIQEMPVCEGYIFKTDVRYGYIAKEPPKDEDGKPMHKPEWEIICYFIALTDAQKKKKKTFYKVRRLIFDEAVLESTDRYHTYLPNEYGILANLVDTVSRERADTKTTKPRLYLLGNACDLANPYFIAYGVTTDLKFGYRWHGGKTFLLHYVESVEYSNAKRSGTVAGRMLKGTAAGEVAINNTFQTLGYEFVSDKPRGAKFSFGIACNGNVYGIWVDLTGGLWYVTDSVPANTEQAIYALTLEDNKINYMAAKGASAALSHFKEMYYLNLVRYTKISVKTAFYSDVLNKFGIS